MSFETTNKKYIFGAKLNVFFSSTVDGSYERKKHTKMHWSLQSQINE